MTTQFHDQPLPANALNQLFNEARSYNAWLDRDVSDETLEAIYDLVKMAPTSANTQPMRVIWAKSEAARQKLAECVSAGNQPKVLGAPVTAIICYDVEFHEQLHWLFPHVNAKSWFEHDEELRRDSAFRNSSLQGAYLILAARALGLDCGPMSGFDVDAVQQAFLADQPNLRVNFICSVGYGDPQSVFDRSPRPDFAKFNLIV